MKVTFRNAHKLRAGNTVWRCLVQGFGTRSHVSVDETLLSGSKYERLVFRHGALYIGPKNGTVGEGEYLNDLHGHGHPDVAAFTTRREALRWKEEVEAGLHPDAVAAATEYRAPA